MCEAHAYITNRSIFTQICVISAICGLSLQVLSQHSVNSFTTRPERTRALKQATIHEELVLASFLIDGDPPKINVGRQAVPVVERVRVIRFVMQLVVPRRQSASVVSSKAAIRGHLKTGQWSVAGTSSFYASDTVLSIGI